ncbi:MAG: single-stranded DNA-binding protein [Bacteroidota bacterium]
MKKGSKIAVEGKLVHRSYEDKEGNSKNVTEINMQEMMMLDSKAG